MSFRQRFYFGYSFNQNFSHNELKESNLLPSVVPHNNYNNFGYGNCNDVQERRQACNSFRNFDKELDDGQQMEYYQGENNFNGQMQQQICDREPEFHPNPNEMFNRDHRPWHNHHHEPYGWKSRPFKRRPSHLLDIWRPNYDDAEQPHRDRFNVKKFCPPNNPRNNYYYNKPIKFVDRFVPINNEKLSTKNKTTTASDVKSTDSCSPATSTSTITKPNEDESKIDENTKTVNIDLPGNDDLIVIDVSGGSNDNSVEEIQTDIADNNTTTSSIASETSVNPITCYSDISQDSVTTNFPLNNEKPVAPVTSDTVTEAETTVTEIETVSLPQKPIDDNETAIDIEKALAMINVDDIDTSKSYLEYCPFVDNNRIVDMDLGSPVCTTTTKTTHYQTKEALLRQLDEAIGDENEDYEENSKNKSSCSNRSLSTDLKDNKPVDRRSPPSEDRSRSDITKRRSSQADRSVDSKKRRISIDNSNTKTAKIYSRRKSLVEVCQDKSSLSLESTDRSARNEDSASKVSKRRTSVFEESSPNSKSPKQDETKKSVYFPNLARDYKIPKKKTSFSSPDRPFNSTISTLFGEDSGYATDKTTTNKDKPFNKSWKNTSDHLKTKQTDPRLNGTKEKYVNKKVPQTNIVKEKISEDKVKKKTNSIKDFVKSTDNKTTTPKGTEKRSNKSTKENVKDNEKKLVSRKEIKETTSKSSSKSVTKEIKETNLKPPSTSVTKEFKENNFKTPSTSVTKEIKETNLKSPSKSVTKDIKEINLKSPSTNVTKVFKETYLKTSTSMTKEIKETNLKPPSTSVTDIKEANFKFLSTSVTKEIKETNLKYPSTSATKEIKETNLKYPSTSVTKEFKETNLKSASTSATKEIKETNLKSPSTSVTKEINETNLKSASKGMIKEIARQNDIHKSPRRSEDYKPQKISNKRRKTSSQSEENKNTVLKSNKHSKKEDSKEDNKNSRKSESLRSENKSLNVTNERDTSKKSCTGLMQNDRYKIKNLTIFLRREVLENKSSLAATSPEDVVTSEQTKVTETPNPDKSNYLVNSQSSEPNSQIPIDIAVEGTMNVEDDNQVNTSVNITDTITTDVMDLINKYFPVRHLDSFVEYTKGNLTEPSKTTDSASTDNAEPQITNVSAPKIKEEPPPKLIQIHTALKSENSDFERSQPLILEAYPPFQKTRIISVENECIEEAVIMGSVDLHDDTQVVKQQNILRQKNDSQEVIVINEKEEEIIDLTDDPVERDDKADLHKLLEIANIDKTEKITLYRSVETEQEDEEVQAMSVCILPRNDATNVESKQSKIENQSNSCKFAEQSSSSNNSDLTPTIVRISTAVPIAEVNPPNKKQHFLSINKNLFETRDETRQISNTGGNTSVAGVSAAQTPSSVSATSVAQPVHIPPTSGTSVDASNSSVAGGFNKTSTERTQTITNDRRNSVGRILEHFLSGQGSQSVRSTVSNTSDSSTNQQLGNTAAPSNNVAQSTNENLNTWEEYLADFVYLTIQKQILSKEYLAWLKTKKVDQLSLNIETLISNASTDFSRRIHGENMVRLLKRLNIDSSVEYQPDKTIMVICNHLRLKGIYSLPQFYICLDSIMSYNKEFYINHRYLRNFYKMVNSCADQIRLKANKELQSTQPKIVLSNQELTTLNAQIDFCNRLTKSFQNQNREINVQSTPRRNSLPIQQAAYPSRNMRIPNNIPQMRPFTQNLPNASPIQQRSSNIYNQQQQVINRKIPRRASIEQIQQHHPTTSQSILQHPVNISNVCNTPNNQQRFPSLRELLDSSNVPHLLTPTSQNRDMSQPNSSNTTFKIPSINTSMLRQVRKIPPPSNSRIQVPTYAVSPAYSTPAPPSRETSTLTYTPSHPMPPSMTHIRNHIYAPMPFTPTYLNEQTVSPPTTESPINESISDRSFVGESTVNYLPINRNPVNKSPTNESTISSSLINQSSVNKSLNKTPIINSSPINQNHVNKSPINETTGNQSPVNKSLNKASNINSSPINQSPVNKSPNNESTNNSSPIDQFPVSKTPNNESTSNSSATIHQSDVNESHINESSDVSNSRSDDLDTNEGIIIDLTWLNDMDSEDLKQELDLIKKEEIDEDEVILNEEQFPLASSPADSGIETSPSPQMEYSELVYHGRMCICENPAEYICGCRMVMYCSDSCQKRDWTQHRPICVKALSKQTD